MHMLRKWTDGAIIKYFFSGCRYKSVAPKILFYLTLRVSPSVRGEVSRCLSLGNIRQGYFSIRDCIWQDMKGLGGQGLWQGLSLQNFLCGLS